MKGKGVGKWVYLNKSGEESWHCLNRKLVLYKRMRNYIIQSIYHYNMCSPKLYKISPF